MYKIVTRYSLLGLRHEHDNVNHTHDMVLKSIPGAPEAFDTEQAAFDWALGNHDDMRRHPDFVVLPVYHMVLKDA